VIHLKHNKIDLALHELRPGSGRALLLLHGLGERSPREVPRALESWPGPVVALDFTGHGASTIPVGGGYSVELLSADADAALRYLGEATVLGRGLGAYVALQLVGGRPRQVKGAILCDGPGLAGGGHGPTSPYVAHVDSHRMGPPDPFALAELSRDLRPREYGTFFARLAKDQSGLDTPLWVCASEGAEWLLAISSEPGVQRATVAEALRACADLSVGA